MKTISLLLIILIVILGFWLCATLPVFLGCASLIPNFWREFFISGKDATPAAWFSLTSREDQPLIVSIISLLGAASFTVGAYYVARHIERRKIALEFVRELNSPEMIRARSSAVVQIESMGSLNGGAQEFYRHAYAFLVMSSDPQWLPGCGYFHFHKHFEDPASASASNEEFLKSVNLIQMERRRSRLPDQGSSLVSVSETISKNGDDGNTRYREFESKHGLPTLVYFICRVQLCYDDNTIDQRIARSLLYTWFLHYYPFLNAFHETVNNAAKASKVDRQLGAEWISALGRALRLMEKLRDTNFA